MRTSQPIPDHAERVFKGVLFEVFQWQQRQFDGSFRTFEKLRRSDAAVIVPVTVEKQIVIIDQEQPGKMAFTGFPAGAIEPGESAEDGAVRELLEETGYVPEKLLLLSAQEPFGKIECTVSVFAALGCRKQEDPAEDPGERTKVRLVSFEEVLRMARDEVLPDNAFTNELLRVQLDGQRMHELQTKLSLI